MYPQSPVGDDASLPFVGYQEPCSRCRCGEVVDYTSATAMGKPAISEPRPQQQPRIPPLVGKKASLPLAMGRE